MDLVTDPAYAPIAPYKFMALQVMLTPSSEEMVFPPLTGVVATLSLLLYLALGWWRASRRCQPGMLAVASTLRSESEQIVQTQRCSTIPAVRHH